MDVTATLDLWSLCVSAEGLHFIVGVVTGDRKGRFREGGLMSTSLITSPVEDLAEGSVATTLNSRYLLARPADEVRLEAFLYAASLGGRVVGPDGGPVESVAVPAATRH